MHIILQILGLLFLSGVIFMIGFKLGISHTLYNIASTIKKLEDGDEIIVS